MIPALLVPSVRPIARILLPLATNTFTNSTAQLTLRQYLIAGGFDDSGTGVSWATSNRSVASVSGSGLVSLLTVGAVTITASVAGRLYSTSTTVLPDEITYLRTNLGVDSTFWLYSASLGVTGSDSAVTALTDARGSVGFGATVSNTGGTIIRAGTGTGRYLQSDGIAVLQSASLAALNLSTPITFVTVSETNTVGYSGTIEYADPVGGGMSAVFHNTGDFWSRAFTQPGLDQIYLTPVNGAVRVCLCARNGTSKLGYSALTAPGTITITAAGSASGKLNFLGGVSTANTGKWRAGLVFFGYPTAGNLTTIQAWAETYHGARALVGTKQFVADGDSNTAGAGVLLVEAWPQQLLLRSFYAPWDGHDVAVNGSQTSNVLLHLASAVQPLYNASQAKNIYLIHVGENNIVGGITGTSTVTDLWTICDTVRGYGFKVVVTTLLPRNASTGSGGQTFYDAERATANTKIRSEYLSHADGLADIAANAAFSANGAWADTTYFLGDGIHMNATGHVRHADIVDPIVQAL